MQTIEEWKRSLDRAVVWPFVGGFLVVVFVIAGIISAHQLVLDAGRTGKARIFGLTDSQRTLCSIIAGCSFSWAIVVAVVVWRFAPAWPRCKACRRCPATTFHYLVTIVTQKCGRCGLTVLADPGGHDRELIPRRDFEHAKRSIIWKQGLVSLAAVSWLVVSNAILMSIYPRRSSERQLWMMFNVVGTGLGLVSWLYIIARFARLDDRLQCGSCQSELTRDNPHVVNTGHCQNCGRPAIETHEWPQDLHPRVTIIGGCM
jgi:hypothetical protein